MRRRVNKEHQFGTALRDGSTFTKFTVGTNHGRWWVQVKEESPNGGSNRYPLWNREGKTDFATELEAITLMLEWVVHHKFHSERLTQATIVSSVHKAASPFPSTRLRSPEVAVRTQRAAVQKALWLCEVVHR